MSKTYYLDNAATTRVDDRVVEAMLPYFTTEFYNPSSLYSQSTPAKNAVAAARAQVAKAIGAKDNDVYFTSCATESTNWAIKGAARALKEKGKNHIITSNIEHHATMHTVEALKKEGFEVSYLTADSKGYLDPAQLRELITDKTGLLTVIFANNEIGTIQPVAEMGAICKERGVLLHTDAVQALGAVELDVTALGADMMSLTGHKIHAPKGVGALYMRPGFKVYNLIDGGDQERRKRSGTENVPYIVGFGKAVELVCEDIPARAARIRAVRDDFIDRIFDKIPQVFLNGGREPRLPANANIAFNSIEGESIVLRLNQKGVLAATGSACSSASLELSHVISALNIPMEAAHGSIRFSFGDDSKLEDNIKIVDIIADVIGTLRDQSPIWRP